MRYKSKSKLPLINNVVLYTWIGLLWIVYLAIFATIISIPVALVVWILQNI